MQSNFLVLAKCKKCSKLFIPPVYICLDCGSTELEDAVSGGEGKLLSFTTIRVPPLGFADQAPYDIGVIELEEGVNLTARLVGQEGKEVKIGDRASFVKKDTSGAYWFKLSE